MNNTTLVKKHYFDVMPSVITPIRNKSERQQKNVSEFSPRTDPGKHSPAISMQQSPRCRKWSPYENRALFLLPPLQLNNLPMTPIPRRPSELPNPMRYTQLSNSNTPPNLTSTSDKGRKAQFGTKIREKCKKMIPIAQSEN